MPLWGNKDYVTGNNKPVFANTTNSYATSTIHGSVANTNAYYGYMMGVSPAEVAAVNAANLAQKPIHAGWNSVKIGTGPVSRVNITGAGTGINANGFIVLTDASVLGGGTGANVSFTIANTQNTLQTYSTNSAWNGIAWATVVSGGSGYSNSSAITYTTTGTSTTAATLSIVLGGRAGRIQTETIVAMGSITLDHPKDNAFFAVV